VAGVDGGGDDALGFVEDERGGERRERRDADDLGLAGERDGLAGREPDADAGEGAGPHGDRDAIDGGKAAVDFFHHALDQRHHRFRMPALHGEGLDGDGLFRIVVEHAGRDGGKGGVDR
jgi:hypothetical protein